ncbi:hypothetical protein [Aquincola tertiaricarbonis]|uniref:hypothetical protein n=1 Tax=Aquincola tertiaricarbonis TaxID=391953 RepID=UPI0018DE2079|nr:hypothetical protein [Aquincola tertiaricarbonis]
MTPEAPDARLWSALHALRYTDLVLKAGVVCALQPFAFTTALAVAVNKNGYQRRYCYEHEHDARAALAAWDGTGHPGGPWIKCKGVGVDLLNPAWSTSATRVSTALRRR